MRVTRIESLISWAALPVYVWQGLSVRRKTVRMPPPEHSQIATVKGKGKEISILVLGDSSAAGVGVEQFEESVAGRLPHLLSAKTGRPVKTKTCGSNSATAGHINDFVVPNLAHEDYHYIVLNIGTNDAKNFHSGQRFCREFGGLLYALQAKFTGARIIWSGLIDLSGVPILPYPLNKILGIRSRIIRQNGKSLCRERGALCPDTSWLPLPENFAKDGFHASSEGYRVWAEELTDYLADLESR